jgi:leucyl aminopeptidase
MLIQNNNKVDFIYNNNKEDLKYFFLKLPNDYVPTISVFSKNKYSLLVKLYDIAFEYKVRNIKTPNKNIYIHCSKNINHEILMINNCMDAIDLDIKPSNIATPRMLSIFIKNLFRNVKGVNIKILSSVEIKKKGLNLLYSLGNGTYNKPYFVIIERIIPNKPNNCIVGKGITFDAGGTNIKTHKSVYDMKYDKTGAVYTLYAIKNIIETTNDISIIGLLPFSENIITKMSLKPGDIIKSYSGKTVEIINTDAEGRLILADALAYSKNYNPSLLIDIATLTGSAGTINCYHSAYFYTKSRMLRDFIEKISYKLDERMLGMPSWIKKNMLKSTVADIKNYSLKCNDSYAATMFLHEFVPKTVKNWVHIDLAHEIYKKNELSIPKGKGILTLIELIKKMN